MCHQYRLGLPIAYRALTLFIVLAVPHSSAGDEEPVCKATMGDFPVRQADSTKCACPNKRSDLFYYKCDSDNSSCFRCSNFSNNVVVSGRVLCDMVIDCPDFTDEILCAYGDPVRSCWYDNENAVCEVEGIRSHGNVTCECNENVSLNFTVHCEDKKDKAQQCPSSTSESSQTGRNWCHVLSCIDMNDSLPTCGCYSLENVNWNSYMWLEDKTWALVMGYIIGAVAILGNVTVIFISVKDLREKHAVLTREEKVTKYSFLSLSISDMIVAICTVALCAILQNFRNKKPNLEEFRSWITPCDIVGTLTMIGSEQSVFTMVLITVSRFWGIVRPFSRISLNPFLIALLLTWMMSIMIAVIPLMPTLEDVFVREIVQPNAPLLQRIQDREKVIEIIQKYYKSQEYTREVKTSWSELRSSMDTLFGINDSYNIGYYNGFMLCVPDIFPQYDPESMKFSLFIFILNFICFLFMVVGYTRIYINQRRSRWKRKELPAKGETQKLGKKIFLILVTDFICWIPIFILGSANIISSYVTEQQCNHSSTRFLDFRNVEASLYITLLLLPINSAANPFVYSASPEHVGRHVRVLIGSIKCRCCPAKDRESASPVPKTKAKRTSIAMLANKATVPRQEESHFTKG